MTDDPGHQIIYVGEENPLEPTGCHRIDFQRASVMITMGHVLNMGCGEDPATLKQIFGPRVVNADKTIYDQFMGRDNVVDVIMDATQPWVQFADSSFELVVLGDFLEQFDGSDQLHILQEASRVGRKLCVTCIEDRRAPVRPPMTEHRLRALLADSGWATPYIVVNASWGFDDRSVWGWLLEAART